MSKLKLMTIFLIGCKLNPAFDDPKEENMSETIGSSSTSSTSDTFSTIEPTTIFETSDFTSTVDSELSIADSESIDICDFSQGTDLGPCDNNGKCPSGVCYLVTQMENIGTCVPECNLSSENPDKYECDTACDYKWTCENTGLQIFCFPYCNREVPCPEEMTCTERGCGW